MAPDRPGRLGPEAIARTTFQTSFRGYDQEHVRAFLDEIAAEMRETREREAAMRKQIEALEARVSAGDHLDEERLTAVLGEETARVLTAARTAATDIRTKAEESAARVLKDAHEEVERVREQASSVLAERTEAAEQEAAKIRAAAEAHAQATAAAAEAKIAEAAATAEQLLAKMNEDVKRIGEEAAAMAEAEMEAARATGRHLVQEAQVVRERVLKDMSRKRKTARSQLEQLRAGRERLLQAYDVVRRTLDEATDELRVVLSEAKVSAASAARRVDVEPDEEIEQLEAEVDAARMAGLTVVPDAAPAVDVDVAVESPADTVAETLADVAPVEPVAPVATPTPVVDDELPPLPDEIPPAPETPDPIVPPRGKGRRRGVPELPPVELKPLTPRDPVEGMRVITGEVPVVEVATADDDVAVVEVVVVEETVVARDDVQADAPAETETEGAATSEPAVNVDDLFARIRAARAEEVAKAEEVLAEPAPADEAAAEDEVAPEPAAEATDAIVDGAAVVDGAAPPDDEALLERRDGALEAIEETLVRKLKRAMADEQNESLDKLRRTRATTLEALLPPIDEQLHRYADPVTDELEAAARAGASFNGDERDGPNVDDVGLELASALVLPLRERITNALRDAAGDEEAGADGLRSCYREWKTQRLTAASSDALLVAFNRGLFDSLPAAAQLRWIVDNGGSPCPDAEDNALAGLVARGEQFPTGHCYPPAHPGCRCLIVADRAAD